MRKAGEAVCADEVALGALFDGRGDVVQTDGALQQGAQTVSGHQTKLQVGLLHQHGVHLFSLSLSNIMKPEIAEIFLAPLF